MKTKGENAMKKTIAVIIMFCLLINILPLQILEVAAQNLLWPTPNIVPLPESVESVIQPIKRINSSDGVDWKFTMTPPSPEVIINNNYDYSGWNTVTVPGELVLQGYDIKNDVEYFYKTAANIPLDYGGKKIILRFDSVYSYARVWVNGNLVGTHDGAFTTWDCDLSNVVTPGGTAYITVGFIDEINEISYASKYAHHNIGGILRDVQLIALPSVNINSLHYETKFDSAYNNATLDISVKVQKALLNSANMLLTLKDKNGTEVNLGDKSTVSFPAGTDEVTLSIPVTSPLKWDAEHPNLYTLKAELYSEGAKLQTNTLNVGFRQITYGGANASEKNKLYINGQPIKLRGVNRHSISEMGRITTAEQDEADVIGFKMNNVNYVRTSHYNPSKAFLDACDKYGIYVEEETAICWEYTNTHVEREYMQQLAEMLQRDKSHASVIIWSLANESLWYSNWGTTPNEFFQKEYDYVKQIDTSRPLKFSYGSELGPYGNQLDIRSQHYAPYWSSAIGDGSIPVINDEYAHISCYNVNDLMADPNVRNFWGESVKIFWDNIYNNPGSLGGALWGGIDDVFMIPADTSIIHQTHSSGSATGYGEWGAIYDIWRREKPEAWLTKKAYSPIHIEDKEIGIPTVGTALMIPVENRFSHTDLSEVTIQWNVGNASGTITDFALQPGAKGYLPIVQRDWANGEKLNLKFFANDGLVNNLVDEYDLQIGIANYVFDSATATAPSVTDNGSSIVVSNNNFNISFDKSTGLITSGTYNGIELIKEGPFLNVKGASLQKWTLNSNGITVSTTGGQAVINISGGYGTFKVDFTVKIDSNGLMKVDYAVVNDGGSPINGATEIGVYFKIANSVESTQWNRDGLWSVYPENHIGRNTGTANKIRTDFASNPDTYNQKPLWNWKDDMKNFYLYQKDDNRDGVATNDFMASKENVYFSQLNFAGANGKLIVESNGTVSSRVNVSNEGTSPDGTKIYIDDANTGKLTYDSSWGSGIGVPNGAYNFGTHSYCNTPGAGVNMTFEGKGVRVVLGRQFNSGKANIYIDGKLVSNINTVDPNFTYPQVVYETNTLKNGSHTVRVEVAQDNASDKYLIIDDFEIITKLIDDGATDKVVFDPSWGSGIAAPNSTYNFGTHSYSNTPGSGANMTFEGKGIKVILGRQSNSGKANIYIDGILMKTIYTKDATATYPQTMYENNGLSSGTHTIRVEVAQDNISTEFVIIDAFEVVSDYVPNTNLYINNNWNYPELAWGNYVKPAINAATGTTGSVALRISNINNYSIEYSNVPPELNSLSISGKARVGMQLTADTVISNGDLNMVEYQWMSKDGLGGQFININGATSKDYTLQQSDFGKYIAVKASISQNGIQYSALQSEEIAFGVLAVDNVHASVVYSATSQQWYSGAAVFLPQNYYKGTEAYNNESGSTATLSFKGQKIRVYASKQKNTGRCQISIDGQIKAEVDTFLNEEPGINTKQLIFESQDLGTGSHEVKVSILGSGSPTDWFVLDAFEIINPVATKTSLEQTIINAQSKRELEYTTQSFTLMQAKLSEANAISADGLSTQTEVDNACAALADAVNKLAFKSETSKYFIEDWITATGGSISQDSSVINNQGTAQEIQTGINFNGKGSLTVVQGIGYIGAGGILRTPVDPKNFSVEFKINDFADFSGDFSTWVAVPILRTPKIFTGAQNNDQHGLILLMHLSSNNSMIVELKSHWGLTTLGDLQTINNISTVNSTIKVSVINSKIFINDIEFTGVSAAGVSQTLDIIGYPQNKAYTGVLMSTYRNNANAQYPELSLLAEKVNGKRVTEPVAFNNYIVSAEKTIRKVALGTKVMDFKGSVRTSNYTTLGFKNCNGMALGENELLGTGTTLDVITSTQTEQYSVIIKGDLTGDGVVSIDDLAEIKSHLLKSKSLDGLFKSAADISENGTISISDLLAIKKHLLSIVQIEQ